MAVSVGDIVRITALMKLLGTEDITNIFHFRVDTNTTPNDTVFMTEVALALDTLYTGINGVIHANVSYDAVLGQNITKDELLPPTAWPVLVAGVNVTEMLPEMVTICVFHRTLKPRVRAAKFTPPVGEDMNINGLLNVASVPLYQAFGDALTAGLTTAGTVLAYVAFNRLLSTVTDVTQAVVPARFRTQRRRRVGVGS